MIIGSGTRSGTVTGESRKEGSSGGRLFAFMEYEKFKTRVVEFNQVFFFLLFFTFQESASEVCSVCFFKNYRDRDILIECFFSAGLGSYRKTGKKFVD